MEPTVAVPAPSRKLPVAAPILMGERVVSPGNPYGAVVPFKTPSEYFLHALKGDPANMERWHEIRAEIGWEDEDNDLHVYPYTHAVAAMLSMGCEWKCKWCPTFKHFQGTVIRADPSAIVA